MYLSAVWSLHVDQGFPDSLENCQRVVRGIKRSQCALPSRPRLPVSSNILCIIYSALNLNSFDDAKFWAACLLAYFVFFCGLLSSLSRAYQPTTRVSICLCPMFLWMFLLIHLAFKVFIKYSKTDPLRKGCNILIGLGLPPLCAVQAVVSYWAHGGHHPVPLFLLRNGLPLTRLLVTDRLRTILLSAGLPGDFSTVFELGQPLLQQGPVFQITLIRSLAGGKGMLTNNILELHLI